MSKKRMSKMKDIRPMSKEEESLEMKFNREKIALQGELHNQEEIVN